MLVVDSSAWAEFYIDSSVGRRIADKILGREDIVVPTIVILEVCKWAKRTADAAAFLTIAADIQNTIVIDLDADMAMSAAEICHRHCLATADAIVYATAQAHDAELLTCDAHFRDLPGVAYFPKTDA